MKNEVYEPEMYIASVFGKCGHAFEYRLPMDTSTEEAALIVEMLEASLCAHCAHYEVG